MEKLFQIRFFVIVKCWTEEIKQLVVEEILLLVGFFLFGGFQNILQLFFHRHLADDIEWNIGVNLFG